ncbi:hypothetical protein GOP47_0020943 [Adiantum capillus-veneris]|uniref:RRM domain-containing protein n=1 Tax=Adiantum capillus-veneris TaxID=13818 RepID=A0A9D4UA52_ADICA|nr:hypothetical protein GOP47_0020943 [Adiantum capillus-veneris]
MAFLRRSSALLRSALPRFQLQEPSRLLVQQQTHSGFLLKSLSPCFGARFMCSVPSTKLFVGGLAWGMDENALRDAFVEYGEVVDAKVVLDRDSGRSKGFGFISFTCTDHAQAAKDSMDGKLLNGRTLRVNFAIEKQRVFGNFGGYGGGDSGGNSSFSSGQPLSNSSFGDSTSQGNDNYFSNNTFNQETLNSVGGNNESGDASKMKDDFFGEDAFDEGNRNGQSVYGAKWKSRIGLDRGIKDARQQGWTEKNRAGPMLSWLMMS